MKRTYPKNVINVGRFKKWNKSPSVWSGKKLSSEHRKKMSNARLGKIPWNKGKTKKESDGLKRMADSKMGDKCHLWKGGISSLLYTIDWTRTLRISIRERDKYTCQVCGEKQGDKAYDVHHIDYDKKNCDPKNLITLCHHCHMKTNSKRDYWINYFYGE